MSIFGTMALQFGLGGHPALAALHHQVAVGAPFFPPLHSPTTTAINQMKLCSTEPGEKIGFLFDT